MSCCCNLFRVGVASSSPSCPGDNWNWGTWWQEWCPFFLFLLGVPVLDLQDCLHWPLEGWSSAGVLCAQGGVGFGTVELDDMVCWKLTQLVPLICALDKSGHTNQATWKPTHEYCVDWMGYYRWDSNSTAEFEWHGNVTLTLPCPSHYCHITPCSKSTAHQHSICQPYGYQAGTSY